MRNKVLIFSLSSILIMGLFTGCAASKNNENQETNAPQSNVVTETNESTGIGEESEPANQVNPDTTSPEYQTNGASNENNASMEIGEVTAIDGYNITLALNNGRGGRMQGNDTAGKQPKASQNTQEQNSTEKPPEVPSDNQPPKNDSTGEPQEKVVIITDNTVINIEDGDSTKAGTIDDITVGCMLSITYEKDDSGNQVPSTVTIRTSAGGPNGQGPEGKNPPTDSAATDSDTN